MGSPAQAGATTTADVTSPETLLAALRRIADDAAAELADSAAALNRANGSAARAEHLHLAAGRLSMSPTDVSKFAALAEQLRHVVTTCRMQHAAAEVAQAAAAAAVSVAQRHIELQGQGAAGAFYQAASGPSASTASPSVPATGGRLPSGLEDRMRDYFVGGVDADDPDEWFARAVRYYNDVPGQLALQQHADVADPELREGLVFDDLAENFGMHGDDRRTCYGCQAWATDEHLDSRQHAAMLNQL